LVSRPIPAGKRVTAVMPPAKRKSFKPPGPASKDASTKVARTSTSTQRSTSISSFDDTDSGSASAEAAKPPLSTVEERPAIPPELLTKLLHHHFDREATRIGKDANKVVGKYMETFVREAIARAALERGEAAAAAAAGGEGRAGDFLEVSEGLEGCWGD
jgi:hypothetical protein